MSNITIPNAKVTINYKTNHLLIKITDYTKIIKFNIIPLSNCNMLLRHPWLKKKMLPRSCN
ncbi:hypothetical protein MKX08_007971 [Trichoderma sp. CBMAI-0020]|nr:hypothetical protein MKX08_007971 [Trichoderma sp. CBMAI-0020]